MIDYARRRNVMVDTQVRPSDVTKFPIIDAMLNVPREMFVPGALREAAYVGENLHLGEGRWLFEPRTLAKMLDALDVQPNELVLDLGAAHGYSTAVLARLAEAVVAVEEDAGMAAEAEATLGEIGADNAAVVQAPLTEGAPQHGPYDVIVVEGAVEELPEAICDQLSEGGRIACLFMKGELGTVRLGHRIGGRISWRDVFNAGAPILPGFHRSAEFAL